MNIDLLERDAKLRLIGGRSHYNSLRKQKALLRRERVVGLLDTYGWSHGAQRRIASELQVSPSTVSRDFAYLRKRSHVCPTCGTLTLRTPRNEGG